MAYHATVLRQLLQSAPRLEFERLATKVDGPRRSDELSRWSQFLALVVGHVGQRHSLRDIESALMIDPALRYHLNTRSVSPSALQTVVDICKSRWDAELFFKWIKQNLKIRSFLGRSLNAIASQIFVALCVYLLVAFQKFVSRTAMGIQAVLRLVQLNLFQRGHLAALLSGRKHDPPDPQMHLRLRAA